MTGNVRSLRGDPIQPRGEVVQDVVDACRRALEMAEAGELCGVVILRQHANEATSWENAGTISRALIGAMVLAQHGLARDWWEDRE